MLDTFKQFLSANRHPGLWWPLTCPKSSQQPLFLHCDKNCICWDASHKELLLHPWKQTPEEGLSLRSKWGMKYKVGGWSALSASPCCSLIEKGGKSSLLMLLCHQVWLFLSPHPIIHLLRRQTVVQSQSNLQQRGHFLIITETKCLTRIHKTI